MCCVCCDGRGRVIRKLWSWANLKDNRGQTWLFKPRSSTIDPSCLIVHISTWSRTVSIKYGVKLAAEALPSCCLQRLRSDLVSLWWIGVWVYLCPAQSLRKPTGLVMGKGMAVGCVGSGTCSEVKTVFESTNIVLQAGCKADAVHTWKPGTFPAGSGMTEHPPPRSLYCQ
jgi:hypothetical protein